MLSVSDAFERVLQESARIALSAGNQVNSANTLEPFCTISAEEICADRDFPPFDRVAMDGIAICYSSYAKGQRQFPILGMHAAGQPTIALERLDACLEVMTGAVLPIGTDTVVRFEDLDIFEGTACIVESANVIAGQNIHPRGSDRRQGQMLIAENQVLLPPHWAVAATVGRVNIKTRARPSVVLIGTGDELVSVSSNPLPHQIRASNIYAISAALRDRGFHDQRCVLVGDDPEVLVSALRDAVTSCQVCILTGAVSAGRLDHVPSALKNVGVTEIFHKVLQRPGKPLWFGSMPDERGLVFGLPGNPVSSLISCYRFIIPALQLMIGQDTQLNRRWARLNEDVSFAQGDRMTLFQPVRIGYNQDGLTQAVPVRNVGSGDLGSLLASDGFVELPAGEILHKSGKSVQLFPWSHG